MKKLISYVLAVVMVLSLVPSAFAAESGVSKFTDIPANAWYLDELAYAVEHGYISGTSANTFSPDAQVTRAQFVTILGRMLNVDTSLYTSSNFDDVGPNSWYSPYVAWASEMGYVNGYSSSEFGPGNSVTVEQMGVIISNYISKSGVVLTPSSTFSGYADEASISRWAQTSMEVMAKYDLLPVNEAGNVRPTSPVIRSEAAVALVRLAKGDGKGGKPISNGTSEVVEQKPYDTSYTDEAKAVANKLHDELWAAGVLKSTMTELEKAIVYYDWMCANCDYGSGKAQGFEANLEHTAYGALVNRMAVCDGLSYGYQMLLATEGIECECIPDYANKHMWNEVILDGKQYKVDMADAVSWSKNPDGSINQHAAELYRDKNFMDEAEFKAKHYGTPME